MRTAVCLLSMLTALGAAPARAEGESAQVRVEAREGEVRVTAGGAPLARYVYHDATIKRPYLCDLCAPGGIQVSRNHPPQQDDLQDHATFHPGLWLAFGDLNGHDYWRLKAKVVHDGFVEKPIADRGRGKFTVRNKYLSTDGQSVVCTETCTLAFAVTDAGHWILWDSTFEADKHALRFGDQEEMGLGFRVATALAVRTGQGGRILNSAGRQNEKEIWGARAAWCDYSGNWRGQWVGAATFPHPDNPRPCWWHVRDYGLQVANGFGERSVEGGNAAMIVEPGKTLRLRYGVLLHSGMAPAFDGEAALKEYVSLTRRAEARN